MPWLAAGAVVGAGIGAISSSNAVDAQTQASDKTLALQHLMFDKTQKNEAPYLRAGNNSLTALMQGLGLAAGGSGAAGHGSLTAPFTAQMYHESPGYKFQMQEGTDAVLNNASRLGGVNSGNTLKALTTFGQGLANQDFQQAYNNYTNNQSNLFNRLYSLTGTGQNAAASLGGFGQNYADAAGSAYGSIGNANSAGSIATGNTLSNLFTNPDLQSAFRSMFSNTGGSDGLNLPSGVATTNFGTGSNPFYVPNL